MKTYNCRVPVNQSGLWFGDFEELLSSSIEDKTLFHSDVPYDVQETDEYFRVQLDVPGVDPEKLRIKVQGQSLSVSAGESKKTKDWKKSRAFNISFSLPVHADASKIEANVENGVMDIIVPKKQEAQVREIPVQSSSSQSFIEKVKNRFNKAH